MTKRPTVGILGGNGWIGSILGRNALASGLILPEHLLVSSSRRPWRYSHWPGVTRLPAEQLAECADILVLAIPPGPFSRLAIEASDKLVVSLMARVPVELVQKRTGSRQIVRAMPNIAAEFRKSYTPWFASPGIDAEHRSWLRAFFGASGVEEEVTCEAHIDYLTALTGSGPAFPALISTILIEHAVGNGLSPTQATRAVLTMLEGASHLLVNGNTPPDEVVHRFISYRGTTTEGLKAMTAHGLKQALTKGIEAAVQAASATQK